MNKRKRGDPMLQTGNKKLQFTTKTVFIVTN